MLLRLDARRRGGGKGGIAKVGEGLAVVDCCKGFVGRLFEEIDEERAGGGGGGIDALEDVRVISTGSSMTSAALDGVEG
jgi:hypothetical protein